MNICDEMNSILKKLMRGLDLDRCVDGGEQQCRNQHAIMVYNQARTATIM